MFLSHAQGSGATGVNAEEVKVGDDTTGPEGNCLSALASVQDSCLQKHGGQEMNTLRVAVSGQGAGSSLVYQKRKGGREDPSGVRFVLSA